MGTKILQQRMSLGCLHYSTTTKVITQVSVIFTSSRTPSAVFFGNQSLFNSVEISASSTVYVPVSRWVSYSSLSIWILNLIFIGFLFLLQIYGVYHTGHMQVLSRYSILLLLLWLFKSEQKSMMAAKNCWHIVVLEVLPMGKGNCIYPPISHACEQATPQTFD